MGGIRSWLKRLPRSNSDTKGSQSERPTGGEADPTGTRQAQPADTVSLASDSHHWHYLHPTRVTEADRATTSLNASADDSQRPSLPRAYSSPPDPARYGSSPVISASDSNSNLRPVHDHHDHLALDKDLYIQTAEVSAASSTQASFQPVRTDVEAKQDAFPISPPASTAPSFYLEHVPEIMQRKIWVRRPGASATLVTVSDDDLVDAVRDVILQKYANSLGRSIDSPDITLKIFSREQTNKNVPTDRLLGPDEAIGRTLDSYYPGGQTIDEALVIEVPSRRTPKPSPRVGNHHPVAYSYYVDDQRPGEGARDYFPPMAVHGSHVASHPQHPQQPNGQHLPHSMAILTTGQLPALPSPGGHSSRKQHRPKYVRQHTSSPTIMHTSQPHSNGKTGTISDYRISTDHRETDIKQPVTNSIAPPAPLPTPPAQTDHRQSVTPPNRATSPHSGRSKRKKQQPSSQPNQAKSINGDAPPPKSLQPALLDGNVPPINVLIVEDNPINLRLLEQFMRKLKVRWKTAMNGREAVNTWRTGGFHLVLMDIQLPVMSGLEATKEIRRLEGVNGIGLGLVGGQNSGRRQNGEHKIAPEDKLEDMSLFKSPVIIVALTASSLQSDRHEALAVGCNDFLTKPVGYPWMLRKVTEWGCMQALIDFDGWRQWKASAEKKDEGLSEEQKKLKEKEEKAKQKAALKAMFSKPPPTTKDKKEESTTKNETPIAERPPANNKNSTSGPTSRGGRTVRGSSSSGSGTILETHREVNED